jgi:hypothetical protein
MFRFFYLFILLINLSMNIKLNSEEIILYPDKIIPESFLIEENNIYGVEKIYDQNPKTSFSFGLNGNDIFQNIIFYFKDGVYLSSVEIINGFQEKDGYYEYNSRIGNFTIYAKDKFGNNSTYYFNALDIKEKQKFEMQIPFNKIIYELDFLVTPSIYQGIKYNDICISEITFYGNDKSNNNLKNNNNNSKLKQYFKTIKYQYNEDYSLFFNKSLIYNFGRGGFIEINNNNITLKYLSAELFPNTNNGLMGKFIVKKNRLTLFPEKILISKGKGEDYRIDWESININPINFIITQEKCFIKLIPEKNYDILKPVINYIKLWEGTFSNAPKGEYIPILIQ